MSQIVNNNKQIIELQYFGSTEFYSSLIKSTHAVFYPEWMYQKSHHPNRTWLYGPNGRLSLSIPLLGGRNQKCSFRDVQIAEDGNWRRIHWRTIHDAYRKSPWFEEYGWQVENLYQKHRKFLMDWNMETMEWAKKVVGLKLDILAQTEPDADLNLSFRKLAVNEPNGFPVYQQVFMEKFGFINNLSVLDLIFCKGPEAIDYLKKLHTHKNPLHS
ncbi:MAG: WbqC family protein [Chitinophagaceae bacterium]|nr:WbqC family protein [Chitinophagaceae bacterium]